MPAGDYGPGTQLEPVMVNITFDSDQRIAEVGVGYHIATPSGRRHEGGFTWYRPISGHAAPGEHVDALQAVMDVLLAAAAHHEGLPPLEPLGRQAIPALDTL